MKKRPANAGFSLMEALIAMALSLLLIMSMATVYTQVIGLHRDAARAAENQDALRIALALLEHDVMHAGYWGPLSATSAISGRSGDHNPLAVSVIGDCGPGWAIDLDKAISARSFGWALHCPPYGGEEPVSGSLVLRRVSTQLSTPEAGVIQVQGDAWGAQLGADGSIPESGHETRDLLARVYYISPRSTGNASLPSLRRKTLQRGPRIVDEEVMPGIAALEILLGVDTDAPGSSGYGFPDAFVVPELASAPVSAVRLTVRSHSDPRLAMTRTVPLRNGPVS